MEVSSRDPSPLAMDLSKGYSVSRLTRSHTEAMDLAKKPEWYHRQPPNCSADLPSPYRTRSRSVSTSYSSLPHDSSVRCRDIDQSPDVLGNYINSGLYHDGVHSNLWHPGFYEQSGDGGPESSGGEEEEEEDSDSDSDVIFLVSSAKEPLLCTSFIQDSVTRIVQPLSPAASSMDEGRSCYHLPQPMSSPSHDSSYSYDSSESSVDIPIHHTRPVVLLSDLSAVYGDHSLVEASSDDSDIEVPVTSKNKKLCRKSSRPQSETEKDSLPKVRRSSRVRKTSCDTPPLTPAASRRSLRRQVKNNAVGIYNESYDSDDVLDFMTRFSSSDESVSPPQTSQRMSKVDESDVGARTQRKSPSKSPQREEQPQCKSPHTERIGTQRKGTTTISVAKKMRGAKQKCQVHTQKEQQVLGKTVNQKAAMRRKRKRRYKPSAPLFPSLEPEIALKYAKRKKRERKSDSFSPFIHIEKQKCTVVNYHEEELKVRSRTGPSQTASKSVSGFVPNTSCFYLGRLSSEPKCGEFLRCCLCGQTANTLMLGDLHGPYYPASLESHDSRTTHNGHPENHTAEDGPKFQFSSFHEGNFSPKVPLDLDECWVHEDCGTWSTGVFLVRGKLYGLKEAALLAQQTICSSCQQSGAIMGCFQKGCFRNYHYTCAIQSGCVLNEDNFSLRCPDHKNKPCVSRQHNR